MFKKIALWKQVLIGLILGILIGIFLPNFGILLKPLGTIFLRCIMMIAPFMIFVSLVSGIISIPNNKIADISLKTIFAFFITSVFAIILGILLANILKPGVGFVFNQNNIQLNIVKNANFQFIDFFINIIPENILGAFYSNNFIQIVFLACFISISLNKMNNTENIRSKFSFILELIIKMISSIMYLAPYATCALVANSIATQGTEILFSLSKLIMAILIAMIILYIIFGILIKLFAKISPIPFYKKSIEYQAIAFSSSSSKIALPVTIDVCEHKLGASKIACRFILPLGASINMCGLAIHLSLTTIFFAQMFGVDLSIQDYIIIIITSTFGSIGGAGVPGSALVMLPLVMSSINLPIEQIAIVAGVDRFLDMIRTTINITGDAAITIILDARMKTLNLVKYYKN